MTKKITKFFFVCFCTLYFSSCGLDTFYVLKRPLTNIRQPVTSNSDPDNNYVEFITNETQNNSLGSDFEFSGTEIFYRIYSSESEANNYISEIDAINDDTHYGASAERLSSKYSLLRSSTSGDEPFVIKATGSDKRVRIRLSEYASKDSTDIRLENKALILIDGIQAGQPLRAENNYTFNFGHHNEDDKNSKIPQTTDEDFSGTVQEIFYVNLFAVAFGHDVTFKNYYSNVLYLGTIKISSANYNNWN